MIKLIAALILCVVSMFAPKGNADLPETYVLGGQYSTQTIIETTDGNIWKVGGTSEQMQGCEVRVVLDSKGTVDVRDDEILEVIAM